MGDHLGFLIQRFIVAAAICVSYCTLGGLLFFYIEECQYSLVLDKEEKPIWNNVRPEQINQTCTRVIALLETVLNQTTNLSFTTHNSLFVGCEQIFLTNKSAPESVQWELGRRCDIDLKSVYKWIYFASITTLTIGYGDIVPKSDVGKVAVIIYSLLGIPLALVAYTQAGKMISCISRLLITLVERYIMRRSEVKSVEVKGLFTGILLFLITLICSAWTISNDVTGWRFIDSFYFIFISLSTIGYGDFVINPQVFSNEPWFAALTTFIIVFGMGILAGTIDSALTILTRRKDKLFQKICSCKKKKKNKKKEEQDSSKTKERNHKRPKIKQIEVNGLTKEETLRFVDKMDELEDTPV